MRLRATKEGSKHKRKYYMPMSTRTTTERTPPDHDIRSRQRGSDERETGSIPLSLDFKKRGR